jgi:Dihaem cytochrome c
MIRSAVTLALAVVLGLGARTGLAGGTGYRGTGAVTPMPDEKLEMEHECGACHAPFPPEFLPMHAWWEIMHELDNHMGEVATLPEDTRAKIQAYLLANASDGPNTERRHTR